METAAGPELKVAVKVTGKRPDWVGVPLIIPVDETMPNPAGKPVAVIAVRVPSLEVVAVYVNSFP